MKIVLPLVVVATAAAIRAIVRESRVWHSLPDTETGP